MLYIYIKRMGEIAFGQALAASVGLKLPVAQPAAGLCPFISTNERVQNSHSTICEDDDDDDDDSNVRLRDLPKGIGTC